MSLLTYSGDSGLLTFTSKHCVAAIDVNIIRGSGTINNALQQLKLLSLFFPLCSLLQKTAAEEMSAPRFRNIVQNMENYLNPLLTQFDFSFSRWSTVQVIRFTPGWKAWQISFRFLSLRKETLIFWSKDFAAVADTYVHCDKSLFKCVFKSRVVRLMWMFVNLSWSGLLLCAHAASLHEASTASLYYLHSVTSYTVWFRLMSLSDIR